MDENTVAEYYAYSIDDEVEIHDIPIDPTGPILVSIIHEGLHCRYPDKEEEEIEKLTYNITDHLTITQWHNLMRRMVEEMILRD